MNVVVDRQPNCRVSLQVEIPAEVVSGERKKLAAYFAQQARIPGFRPGKAPKAVIEKRFQKEINEELRTELIRRGVREAIDREKLDVLHVSRVENDEFHVVDGTFSFSAELQIAPDFALPDYKGIPVEVEKAEVRDDDIDQELQKLRSRMATYE